MAATESSLSQTINDDLLIALEDGRVRAAYQPIVEVASGRVVAEEALARYIDRQGQVHPAFAFIEGAEQREIVHRIDHRLACDTIHRCSQQIAAGREPIAHFVNISANLLRHRDLVQDILDTAVTACTTCFPESIAEKPLVIEITERQLLDNIHETKKIMAPFLDFGLRLAIDDFGSGYSSLLYLADLPITFLKIEGELVRRAPYEAKVRAILKGVQDLAGELDLITIAEFVESEQVLDVVREIGVDWAQGYHFGRPEIPPERY